MELTEFEQGLKQIVATMHNGNPSHIKEVAKQIRDILPPICTSTERAFLDEIREKFAICNKTLLSRQPMAEGDYVALYQSDFKCNLQELMEKKG